MAQVPYSPTPEVSPSNQAIQGPRADAPAAAFGADVAGALQGLGRAMEGSANELFGRAVALQQLNNQTEAAEAETKFMIEAGQLHAEFNSLQGKARVDAFPKHQEALEAIRAKIGESLSNDMSRKLYTTQSRATLGRTMFNAAGAAATANRQWTKDTVISQQNLDIKTVEDNPKDVGLFHDKERRVIQAAKNVAAQEGAEPGSPQEQLAVAAARSKIWSQRIIGLSRTNPFEAKILLDKNRGMMLADDLNRADSAVTTQARAVGSTNIANEVYAVGTAGPKVKTLAEMEADAENMARKQSPDDPILAKQAVAAVQSKFNQAKYAEQQEQRTNEQIVLGAMQSGVKNQQELLADPKVAAAYEALPSSSTLKKHPLNFQVNKFNTQRDLEEMQTNGLRLRGLAMRNPMEFLNVDLSSEKLSVDDQRYFLAQREKIIKQQGGDPRVSHAMQVLRGARGAEMRALKVFNSTESPEDYDKFTGMLQIALDDYIVANKKPADAKTITEEIGPRLMKSMNEEGRLWGIFGDRETQMFKPGTHTKDYNNFAEAFKAKIPQATDQQVYKAYQRALYQQLYGKKGE